MFTVLDFDHWPRREIFTCFRRTAIYLTVQVDVTGLWRRCKRGGLRLYPALIYGAARVVNGDPAFRYGFDQQGRLGLWDRLTPYYTVPRREGGEELFSIAATEYVPDFSAFSDACLRDMEAAEGCGRLLYQDPLPENGFGISCVPGTSFSAFNFAGDVKEDLVPFSSMAASMSGTGGCFCRWGRSSPTRSTTASTSAASSRPWSRSWGPWGSREQKRRGKRTAPASQHTSDGARLSFKDGGPLFLPRAPLL